jgi:hypothetical protein
VRVNLSFYGYTHYEDARQPLLAGASIAESNEPHHVKIKQPDPAHVTSVPSRRIGKAGVEAFVSQHTDSGDIVVFPRLGKFQRALVEITRQMKDWLNDTFRGIGPKHLQAYLDEFCFRTNRQLRSVPVFGEMLHWCASTPTRIYRDLTCDKPVLSVPWAVLGSKAKWKGRHLSRWSA